LTANTNYSFTIKAKDAAGNLSLESETLELTTNASDDEGPSFTITPDIDWKYANKRARVPYQLSAPALLTTRIVTQTNKRVQKGVNNRKVKAGDRKARFYTAKVKEGKYKLLMWVKDPSTAASTSVVTNLIVDHTKPSAKIGTATEISTMPNSGVADTSNSTVSFNLKEDSKTTVRIFNSNGFLVKTILKDRLLKKGANTVTWGRHQPLQQNCSGRCVQRPH
jgi:ribosomal protein L7Ae-like RNA K-turn-binding protein